MSVQYASYSVGRHRSNNPARNRRDLFDKASDMLNALSMQEIRSAAAAGTKYNVRFIGPDHTPTMYKGDLPADSRWAGISAAEAHAAREKVRRVRDSASAPLVRFQDRLRKIREATARQWEQG